MIQIFPSEELTNYTRQLVENNNFGQRGYADGNSQMQYTGMICENVVRNLLGLPLAEGKGFDGGWDIMYKGLKTDIKAMGRKGNPRPDHVNNVYAPQIKYNNEAYIFCTYNIYKKVVTICGWIDKNTFLEKAELLKKGTRVELGNEKYFIARSDSFQITNNELYEFTY